MFVPDPQRLEENVEERMSSPHSRVVAQRPKPD